jgi:mono/diheme cytochrome c family protein
MKRIALTAVLLLPLSAVAETPREAWINAKCAVCHGMDGASQTDAGKSTNAPDLRAPKTQDQSDAALSAKIGAGHKKMPSFKHQATAERVKALLQFIRSLKK